MEQFEGIRRDFRAGASIRELAGRYGVHRRTVRAAIADAVPPARKVAQRVRPVAGPWVGIVREILEADRTVHRKQRHTARRIWERLLDEHGAQVGESTVRHVVAECKREMRWDTVEVTVPQTHLPGREAEADFGEFDAVIDGQLCRLHLFVMRLSCSGRAFHAAYPSPSTEAFLDGHVRAFAAFGAVPGRVRYDNLSAAVVKVLLGRDRLENPRFIALRSHYGFDSFFCQPGVEGAHEKGGVEGEIGRFRRRHLTPVPTVGSLAQLNRQLGAADAVDDQRRIGSRRQTVGQGFTAESGSLMALPGEVFDAATDVSARVDPKARIAVRGSHYSVPARLAGLRVQVGVAGLDITVRHHGQVVATHPRAVRRGEQVLELDHYLEVLTRKPGALPGATALARARAGGMFTDTHQRLWDTARAQHGDGPGTRTLIEVLLLHRTLPGAAVAAGITAALAVGCVDPDVIAVQARRVIDAERPIADLAATGTEPVGWSRPLPSLHVYDTLLEGNPT